MPPRGAVATNSTNAFLAYALDSDGAYKLVTTAAQWSSSDPSVARTTTTVGTFLAAGPGSTTISARYDGVEATFPMVVVAATSTAITAPTLRVTAASPRTIGGTAAATATLLRPQTANQNVTTEVGWTSSDPAVATIDQDGRMRGVGIGTTLITAQYQNLSQFFWASIAPPQ
ncbi:MAG: Ig-like domain-containing protein [Cyanobacteria bacterium]|nr:Ig-like domain-containing protein [Cyanobacteriota bacterium]